MTRIFFSIVAGPACSLFAVQAFATGRAHLHRHRRLVDNVRLNADPTADLLSARESKVASLSSKIDECVEMGQDPESWVCRLEELNLNKEPNRDAGFLGEWHVWYTNAPPPSNGQLGPFKGTAAQNIEDANSRSYQNLLAVPPHAWLMATLEGLWEDWDGVFLDTDKSDVFVNSTKEKNFDWGATHWKVTFLRLKIQLWNRFMLVDKTFPPSTSRVWRTTYLDDEIRVVRAGKTGRMEDEVVFYTKRTPTQIS